MWRQRFALGVVAVWIIVSLARLSKLVEPPATPPGEEAAPLFDAFRAAIPRSAGYLFVLPGEFGADTGLGPRLRYELYPRTYDDVRASVDEASVRELMRREGLTYIVVADAGQYPPTSYLRQPRDWLERIELDAARYVLRVVA